MSAPARPGVASVPTSHHQPADTEVTAGLSDAVGSARNGWRLWSRADLRVRWRSLIVLGILAGLAVGIALAAFDGARRTSTALARLRAVTNASDAIVFPSQVGVPNPDFTKLEHEPEFKKVAPWASSTVLSTAARRTYSSCQSVPRGWATSTNQSSFPAGCSTRTFPTSWSSTRTPSPMAHFHVGDVMHFHAEGNQSDETTGTLTGPEVDLRIVGVVRTAGNFLFTGGGTISPAFGTHHAGRIIVYQNAFVPLRNGSADVPQLLKDANDDVAPGTPVLDENAAARRVTTTTDVEHTMLLLLSLVVLLAGSVLVG